MSTPTRKAAGAVTETTRDTAANKAAIAAVEKAGGTVTILEAPKELGDGKRAQRKKEAMAKREARNQD